MKNTLKLILLSSLASCATSYHEKGVVGGGYEDDVIGPNQYSVTFHGNGYTGLGDVRKMANRRAIEICKGKGFTPIDKGDDESYIGGNEISCYRGNCKRSAQYTKHAYTIIFSCNGGGGSVNTAGE